MSWACGWLLNNAVLKGRSTMKSFIKIHIQDNVLLASRDIQKGEPLNADGVSIEVKDDIKRGHKIALRLSKKTIASSNTGFQSGMRHKISRSESIFMSIIRKQICLISKHTAILRDLMRIRIQMRTGRLKDLEERTEMPVYEMSCGLCQLSVRQWNS